MGNVLVEHHYVEPEFVDSVLERDRHASTRVAPFVTIPHSVILLYVKHFDDFYCNNERTSPMAWGTDTYRTAVSNKEKGFETCRVQKNFFCYSLFRKAARTNGTVDAIQSSTRDSNLVV